MTPTIRSIHLANGVRLQYAEQGDPAGMPVVLLHGITDSWRSFEPVMAHLPASLHVFALSQRGHGESDRPGRYRTRDFAGDAAAFIDGLGLGRSLVVGHSMGSTNAMRLAIDRPDLLRGLMAVGSFATFSDNAGVVESLQPPLCSSSSTPVPATKMRKSRAHSSPACWTSPDGGITSR